MRVRAVFVLLLVLVGEAASVSWSTGATNAASHARKGVQPPPKITSMVSREARWMLANVAYMLLVIYENHLDSSKLKRWRDMTRVFPTYQLYRGHFAKDDDISAGRVCRDWMPGLGGRQTEEEVHTCWKLMHESVGDSMGQHVDFPYYELFKALLKLIVGGLALFMPRDLHSTTAIWAPPRVDQSADSAGRTCPNLRSSDDTPGVYEHISEDSWCSGTGFGAICHLRCADGYRPSRQWGHTVVCGMASDKSDMMMWLPGGDAYQHICVPDILYSTQGMVLHLNYWDADRYSWVNTAWKNRDANANGQYEPCWDNGMDCGLKDPSGSANARGHLPTLTLDNWLSFRPDGWRRKSLRVQVPGTRGLPQLSLFTVFRPKEATWQSVTRMHGLIDLEELESRMINQQDFEIVKNRFFAVEATECNDKGMLLAYLLSATSETSGKLHIRLNGYPLTNPDGLRIYLHDNVFGAWPAITPLFYNEMFQSPMATRVLADPMGITSAVTRVIASGDSAPFGGLSVTACVSQAPATSGFLLHHYRTDLVASVPYCLAVFLDNSATAPSVRLILSRQDGAPTSEITFSGFTIDASDNPNGIFGMRAGRPRALAVIVDEDEASLVVDGAVIQTQTVTSQQRQQLRTCDAPDAVTTVGGQWVNGNVLGGFSGTVKNLQVLSRALSTAPAAPMGAMTLNCEITDEAAMLGREVILTDGAPQTNIRSPPALGTAFSFCTKLSQPLSGPWTLFQHDNTPAGCTYQVTMDTSQQQVVSLSLQGGAVTASASFAMDLSGVEQGWLKAGISIEGGRVTFFLGNTAITDTVNTVTMCQNIGGTHTLSNVQNIADLKNFHIYQTTLSATAMRGLDCQQRVTAVSVGRKGLLPPDVEAMDMMSYFDGDLGDVVAYTNFLDPAVDDQWNLRRLEAIEWHLASRWKFSHAMTPAKPGRLSQLHNRQDPAGDMLAQSHMAVTETGAPLTDLISLKIVPQGGGYDPRNYRQRVIWHDFGMADNAASALLSFNQQSFNISCAGQPTVPSVAGVSPADLGAPKGCTKGGRVVIRSAATLAEFPRCISGLPTSSPDALTLGDAIEIDAL